jgi:hypothetical protein
VLACGGQSGTTSGGHTGTDSAEPHLGTFDGRAYDFQTVGEFDMVESSAWQMDVQARTVAITPDVSATGAIAFRVSGHIVELHADGSMLLDRIPYTLATGTMIPFGDGGVLAHTPNRYVAVWPGTGPRPILTWTMSAAGTFGNFWLYMPPTGGVVGLFGNANGDRGDDFALRDGTPISASASSSTIEGEFANSWRISDADSLFTYGAGDSTATYTDETFPAHTFTLGDLTTSDRAEATNACNIGGVAQGPQFDSCVFDYVLSGGADFVAANALVTKPLVVGGAVGPDSSGDLGTDFEGALPPNLAPSDVGSNLTTGTFAGPYTVNSEYAFSVPDMPSHLHATIGLDAITVGDWSSSPSTETLKLTVDGSIVWTGHIATGTPAATGFLATGQPYAVYHVSATFDHWRPQMNVSVSSSGLSALSGQAFGVDNLSMSLDLLGPQAFAVSLPLDTATAGLGSGVGDLETHASEDDYSFTLSSSSRIQIELRNCVGDSDGSVEWNLFDASGRIVDSLTGCGERATPELAPGSYTLAVRPRNGGLATYSLRLYAVPPADSFDISLPLDTSTDSLGSGAADLETDASEDDYTFTLGSANALEIDPASCAPGQVSWSLTDISGATVDQGRCDLHTTSVLPAGGYTLHVTPQLRSAGTYALHVFVAPPPDAFSVSLPVNTATDSLGSGAANLETNASEDDYAFTLDAAHAVEIDPGSCPWGQLQWTLFDSTGMPADVGTCQPHATPILAAGSYTLKVAPQPGYPGTYDLRVYVVPPSDVFSVSLPVNTATDSLGSGVANLETNASEDDYTFTLGSAHAVEIDASSCPWGQLRWSLVNASGTTVDQANCDIHATSTLAAGTYTLKITPQPGYAGTYALSLFAVTPPDAFAISLPLNTATDSLGSGVANLETNASEDDYTFTLGSAHAVEIDASSCPWGQLRWSLVNASGTTVDQANCDIHATSTLAAGTYTLKVRPQPGYAGTYNLHTFVVPAPDVFSVSLPVNTATDSLGSGAANLETNASEDDYSFTLGSAQAVEIDASSCPSGQLRWSLVDSSNTSVDQAHCDTHTTGTLAAGTYTLRVTPQPGYAGTYQLRVHLASPPPPSVGSVLGAGETLGSNESLASPSGRFTLTMQDDGNLVLYDGATPIWASNTDGHAGATLTMQSDGNLVVYTTGNSAIFATGTNGHAGADLEVQNDGNVVIYSSNHTALWATGTNR